MRYLGTYRQVPPIAPEAWAIAVVVFATYVGSAESNLPESVAPVSLAVALQVVLRWTWTIIARFRVPRRDEWLAAGIFGAMVVFVPIWLWTASDLEAMLFRVGFTLCFAMLFLVFVANPAFRHRLPSPWARIGRLSALAITLDAAGRGLIAATGLLLIALGDPLLFVGFMTFGSHVFVFMTNWAILLVVLALSRDDDA